MHITWIRNTKKKGYRTRETIAGLAQLCLEVTVDSGTWLHTLRPCPISLHTCLEGFQWNSFKPGLVRFNSRKTELLEGELLEHGHAILTKMLVVLVSIPLPLSPSNFLFLISILFKHIQLPNSAICLKADCLGNYRNRCWNIISFSYHARNWIIPMK